MAITVLKMNKPQSCDGCPFVESFMCGDASTGYRCWITKTEIEDYEVRLHNCPIVEEIVECWKCRHAYYASPKDEATFLLTCGFTDMLTRPHGFCDLGELRNDI